MYYGFSEMTEIFCPYCDQDVVWRIAFSGERKGVFTHAFCFECDTIWEDGKKIDNLAGLNYETYMENSGKKADWTIIQRGYPATTK